MIARNIQKVLIFFKRNDLVSYFSQLVFLLSLIRLEIFFALHNYRVTTENALIKRNFDKTSGNI